MFCRARNTQNQLITMNSKSSALTSLMATYPDSEDDLEDTNASDGEDAASVLTESQTIDNGRPLSAIDEQSPSRQGKLASDEEPDSYGVMIPPEPPGACSAKIMEKFIPLFTKVKSNNMDMNKLIQGKKSFRNPSMCEKLIEFCNIDELGTNYPPESFDPYKWGKESFYEELAKVQDEEMEKRMTQKKKPAVKLISGVAKIPSCSWTTTADEDAKRKKCNSDQVANGAASSIHKPSLSIRQPTFVSSLTSTRATTVISAFDGPLPRRKKLCI